MKDTYEFTFCLTMCLFMSSLIREWYSKKKTKEITAAITRITAIIYFFTGLFVCKIYPKLADNIVRYIIFSAILVFGLQYLQIAIIAIAQRIKKDK